MIKKQMVLMLLISFCAAFAQKIERTFDVTAGQQLSVEIKSGGSIDVQGWDKNQVNIIVNARSDYFTEDDLQIRKHDKGIHVEIGFLNHRRGSGDLNLTIRVPQKFDLELETMGGQIGVRNVEGNLKGKTMGGALNLSDLKGTVQMTTMGGGINLKNAHLDGELKTMGGNIYFEDVVGNVKGNTMGGKVEMRNVRTMDQKEKGEVQITTMGGSIDVDDAPMGANVHTMGGKISIKKAREFVQAKTMGGNIKIAEIDGWVKASTMGGSISVTMVGDPDKGDRHVNLSSMGGDITLTLPANISADFDIQLTYTKDSSKKYQIQSEFDLAIQESADWEYRKGTPYKEITGLGKTRDGKNKIFVKTTNGQITIKKGK